MSLRVTIITINLNNKSGLQKTMDSVWSQSHQDIEFIVIDGGSNDGSLELIKENEGEIKYWVSEEDKGIYNAMNKGIDRATGDYLLFLNSGDYLYDEAVISHFVKSNPTEAMLYGDIYLERKNLALLRVDMPQELSLGIALSTAINHQSMLLKSSLFSKGEKYMEEYSIVADWVFYIDQVILKGLPTRHLNQIISVSAAEGVSENLEINNAQRKIYLEKNFHENFVELLREYKKVQSENNRLKGSRLVKMAFKMGSVFRLFSQK